MRIGQDDKPARAARRIEIGAPLVVPFRAPMPAHPRPRSILIDAAVCFLATALGSLAPQALNSLDLIRRPAVVANVDPESGKFLDRVIVGGLQPLSWEEAPAAPPLPALMGSPAPSLTEDAEEARPAPQKLAARPAREFVARKAEKAPDAKSAEAAIAPEPMVAATPDAIRPQEEQGASQGTWAALTPSSVLSKLAPMGEKAWSGARAVGGAVASGLSWLGY